MSVLTEATTARPRPRPVAGDRVFQILLVCAGCTVLGLATLLGVGLARGAAPAMAMFGIQSLIGTEWDPVHHIYGALPFIWGTLYSSLLALLIAVPIGVGTAIFLAEVAPRWLAQPMGFVVELLAAVPSVVFGMWAIFVALPVVRAVQIPVSERWGHFPLFEGPPLGIGVGMAGIILAIMILPFIVAVSRDAIVAVPRAQAEAGLALGATRWETIRGPILRYARKGIFGSIVLALGRALGETMAVTMVIGNTPRISVSVLRSGYTMSSVLANEFGEAMHEIHLGSLVNIALLLLIITLIVNALARLLIWGATVRDQGDDV